MKLLGIDSNAKTVKGLKKGFQTAIMYLSPSDGSGVMNTCPAASKGCRNACLNTAGRGRMSPVQEARINKTKFLADLEGEFMRQLDKETLAHIKRAARKGLTPCERLNGTSDIAWETYTFDDGSNIFERHPDLQFYDYTKRLDRMFNFLDGHMPPNYHLTFSRSETTKDDTVKSILQNGGNVAVVYGDTLPVWDFGAEVINGDETDLRFLDPRGKVVGLLYKRTVVNNDETGFVLTNRVKNLTKELA